MSAPDALGNPFIELAEVESTNNYAMALLHEARLPYGQGMAQHGTAVFTTTQSKGKGQRTKTWLSEPGKNIALSIIAEPRGLAVSQFFILSMAVSVAVRDVFANYAGEETKIKWPNDIYWRDRKAAGILIENIVQANNWKYAIIGIGCNVNQVDFGELQKQAVSLKQITGKELKPADIAKQFCAELNMRWQRMFTDADVITKEYKNHLYKLHEKIKLKKDSRVFEAELVGVTNNGQLVVQHGVEERFDVGEVEWVIHEQRQ